MIESRRKEVEGRKVDGRARLRGTMGEGGWLDRMSWIIIVIEREGRSMGEHDWEARWERAVGWIECRGS